MREDKEREKNYYVDNTWTCGCGALNAVWLEKCGNCDIKRRDNRVNT